MDSILSIRNLRVAFDHPGGRTQVLRGVRLSVGKAEVVGLAGESGCGKTMTALAIAKLLPKTAVIEQGSIVLDGEDVVPLDEGQMRRIRGRKVGMVFQEPSAYLNPVFSIGVQLCEAVEGDRQSRRRRARDMLAEVGLPDTVMAQYPHQLSGGMQQRVLIAMALINNPRLLVADEPTTALDVTTAMQVLDLLKEEASRHGTSVLFITHDLSLAGFFCKRIGVMYAGVVVETGEATTVLSAPKHPYTRLLVNCLPERYRPGSRITVIPGSVPDFRHLPAGCPFHPRCPERMAVCERQVPGETETDGVRVRCFKYGNAVEG